MVQQGGEAIDCTGVDCDLAEAEVCIEGGLQEEKVLATWSAPKKDQSHPKKAYQVPGISEDGTGEEERNVLPREEICYQGVGSTYHAILQFDILQ